MMDDLPFRARAIWDSDCGIVLLDGQHQVVSVIVRMLYSSMIVVQDIFVVYAEGPRVPRDMWNKSHRGAWAYGHRTHNKFPRSVLFWLGYIATIHDYYLNDNSSILFIFAYHALRGIISNRPTYLHWILLFIYIFLYPIIGNIDKKKI